MFDSDSKNSKSSSYPNIILKKKLAPLPLLNQNISPKHLGKSPSKDYIPTMSAIRDSFRSPPHLRSSKLLQNNLRSINNYGRLCDQPFLEFSSFHSEQVFGSGGGKKKVVLEPLQKKKQKGQQAPLIQPQEVPKEVQKQPLISIQDTVEIPQVKVNKPEKPKKEKDTEVIVKKVYKVGDYEAIMAFYSLQVILLDEENQVPRSVYVEKGDLRKIYTLAHNVIEKSVLDSLSIQDGDLKIKIKKNKHTKQEYYTGEETYPEKSEEENIVIHDKKYTATIYYPYLEISIPALNYQEKVMLKALYLSNLYEEKFNNLQDYVEKFNLPPQIYKGKDEIHIQNLKNLPTIIKKVVKTDDFGGLLLFKTVEIHLKNTSNIEPKTLIDEPDLTPRSKRLLRRQNRDINSVIFRLKLNEVNQLLKCSPEEFVDLAKESVFVEQGTGFEIKLNEEKVNIYEQRHNIENDSLPEHSESFNVRFNRFLYEGYIKFPTLELYIPETTYKDVIQLKPSQLQDLLDNEMKNLEDYMHLFKKPTLEQVPAHQIEDLPQKISTVKEEVRNENLKNLPTTIKKVVKNNDFGGLLLFRTLEIHVKNAINMESKTQTNEPNPSDGSKKLLKRQHSTRNAVVLRLKLNEVNQLLKCTPEEIVALIQESECVAEGSTFEIKLNQEKVDLYEERPKIENDSFPERSEPFNVKFNQSVFEGFIKFPTLELYIPETNYKDVIQLKPSQLQDLLDNEMKNIEDYMDLFKKPPLEQSSANNVEASQANEEKNTGEANDNNNSDYPGDQKVLSYKQKTLNAGNI